ncbi:hypothetical protein FRC12_005324 [Ceratobasidium sp. 428]|nr:hypothetical protein FRC12_005324 [Ceratobasidium sp. 428]
MQTPDYHLQLHNRPAYFANLMRFAGQNAEDLSDLMDFDANFDFNADDLDERDEYDANFGLPNQGCKPPVAKTR